MRDTGTAIISVMGDFRATTFLERSEVHNAGPHCNGVRAIAARPASPFLRILLGIVAIISFDFDPLGAACCPTLITMRPPPSKPSRNGSFLGCHRSWENR
jgi:hypothetical protein